MSNLLQTGTLFRPIEKEAMLIQGLPLGVYQIEQDNLGVHLKSRDPFRALPRVYGKHPGWSRRILDTFAAKDGNMGVLLAGEKGGGKSLLARLISHDASLQGMSTLVLEADHGARGIGVFLSTLTDPTVVFVDEFEKIFRINSGAQEEFLSLLDGTSGSRHLFLLTVNDVQQLNGLLLNRPGRIHYRIDFTGLDRQFILDYCGEHLEKTEELDGILLIASCFENFNFDMLKSLVEEINRYGETAVEAARLLNISPENTSRDFELAIDSKDRQGIQANRKWRGNPLIEKSFHFEYNTDPDSDWPQSLEVLRSDSTRFDPREDVYIFEKNGFTVRLQGIAGSAQGHWLDALASAS